MGNTFSVHLAEFNALAEAVDKTPPIQSSTGFVRVEVCKGGVRMVATDSIVLVVLGKFDGIGDINHSYYISPTVLRAAASVFGSKLTWKVPIFEVLGVESKTLDVFPPWRNALDTSSLIPVGSMNFKDNKIEIPRLWYFSPQHLLVVGELLHSSGWEDYGFKIYEAHSSGYIAMLKRGGMILCIFMGKSTKISVPFEGCRHISKEEILDSLLTNELSDYTSMCELKGIVCKAMQKYKDQDNIVYHSIV